MSAHAASRQLCEDDSGRAVGSADRERINRPHHRVKHRGAASGLGNGRHRAHDGTGRAARSACAALVLVNVASLGCTSGIGRRRPIADGLCRRGVLADIGACAWRLAVMRDACNASFVGVGRLCTAMVGGATKRHRCGGRCLGRNCQHQQPDQQRSDQQTHACSLPQPSSASSMAVGAPLTSVPEPLPWVGRLSWLPGDCIASTGQPCCLGAAGLGSGRDR